MDDSVFVLPDWPQPASVSGPLIVATDTRLVLRYSAADGTIAVVTFSRPLLVQFGSPNDEALGGHPLARRGLKFYSVHEVRGSSRLAALETQNSIHPRHDRQSFLAGLKHFIFTFQDSTLEVIAQDDDSVAPQIALFPEPATADSHFRLQAALP